MATTQNTYTGNGSTTQYAFTFPYLETTDIKVSLNGINTTAYTLANATTVQFNTAPTNGAAIRIYRETPDSNLSSTFYTGSAIRSQDLNTNFNQALYIAQETKAITVAASSGNLADGSVTSSKLANEAVSEGKLGTNAVSTVKIQNGAVTAAKLADTYLTTASAAGTYLTQASATATYQPLGSYNASFTLTSTGVNKTIVANEWVRLTASGLTITLPATPTDGMQVRISVGNYTNTTIARNGVNIMGLTENMTIDKTYTTVTLIYDVTGSFGWRII